MKFALCILGLFGAVIAFPEVQQQEVYDIDWTKITPRDIYVEKDGKVKTITGVRIIGGTEVEKNSIPYQAALIIDGDGFCGGSLISPNYILTAAHCTFGAESILVILGAHNIQSTEETQQRILSEEIITHLGYNPPSVSNDIGVIKLTTAAILNNAVAIISILAKSGSESFANQKSLLTGWGRTSDSSQAISPVLLKVDLTVITNSICASSFGSSITSTNICTSGAGIKGGCNGDSGGPLLVGSTQVGVVSFGSPRCEAGAPTVFTRVSEFQSWIADHSDVTF